MSDFKLTLETPSGTYVRSYSGWKILDGADEYELLQKRALEVWRDHLYVTHGSEWESYDPIRGKKDAHK